VPVSHETRRAAAAAFAALCAWACGGSSPTPPTAAGLTPVAASAEWRASSPAAEGLDEARIADLVSRIRRGEHGRIESLLVARNGRLAVEEYFGAGSASRPHTMQSVTKSVVSLLAGVAVQKGVLRVEDRVASFFPEYRPLANLDERKAAVTVRDLLTMRTGLDWTEDPYAGSPLQRLNECRCDWLRFVLDWPMREPPGARWEYVSGGVILLGGIVGSATGQRLDRFAAAELFGPLGITAVSWFQGLPDGLPHGGGGLFLRSRDMAKVGQLVLDEGRFEGRAVVAPEWIRESTRRVTTGVTRWAGRTFDYAYLWWLATDDGADVVTAAGAQGQFIFVVPRSRLVVVATSDNDDARWAAPVGFLFSDILPSAL
jgi:CubicO group peptidase (beta-lactamase class C family)